MPRRRPRLPFALLVLVLGVVVVARGVGVAGEAPPAVEAPARPATKAEVTADDVRERVRFLACDALCGRMSVEAGCFAASQYVADEFARFGLVPAGDGGGWFQGFEIPMPRLGAGNALEMEVGGTTTSFEVEKDWNPFAVSPSTPASGPLLFAGYGVTAPEKAYDDYAGIDAKGKVVLVLRKEPAWEKSPSKHATFVEKLNQAAAHGAAALLVVNDPRTTAKAPDRLMHWSSSLGPQPGSGKVPFAFVSQATAAKMLAPLATSLESLQKAIEGDGGEKKPASADVPGVVVRVKAAIEKSKGVNARNVAGLLEGSDPALRKEIVVVGAHHDHVGRGTFGSAGGPADEGKIHPGADDNASGTAALLEMAEAMAASPSRPKRSVLFLSFSGEEMGLLGSVHYVEHPLRPLADTVAMVNFDMVGRFDPKKGVEVGGVGTGTGFQALVEKENGPYGLPLRWDPQGSAPTDSTSFFRKKIPVLWFFTGLHPEYHTPRDTWERIDAASEATITLLSTAVVREIADRGERVAYTTPPRREGKRPALGIQPAEGSDGQGVVIGDVVDGGAAQAAGMEVGDVITAFDKALVKTIQDFMRALAAHKPGDRVLVKVLRDGVEKAFEVTLGSR